MTEKNEKGFALVLAIVLLLAMSLMGGGLILVSSGDHRSNTSSDNYQQTFYVAETALLEAEKYLLHKLQGTPMSETTRADDGKMPNNTTDDLSDFDNDRACVRSFIDYDRDGLDNTNNSADDYVVIQKTGLNSNKALRSLKIIDALKQKFPKIKGPIKEDICYATTNRQNAVKKIASKCDMFFVIGSENSSNSKRLVEVAKKSGCKKSELFDFTKKLPIDDIVKNKTIGLTSGASAPEKLIQNFISEIKKHCEVSIEEIITTKEKVIFKLPKELN